MIIYIYTHIYIYIYIYQKIITLSTKAIAAVFPRGSQKRKSNNDNKRGHGQEKRRPSILC